MAKYEPYVYKPTTGPSVLFETPLAPYCRNRGAALPEDSPRTVEASGRASCSDRPPTGAAPLAPAVGRDSNVTFALNPADAAISCLPGFTISHYGLFYLVAAPPARMAPDQFRGLPSAAVRPQEPVRSAGILPVGRKARRDTPANTHGRCPYAQPRRVLLRCTGGKRAIISVYA
jgi:hypothetical protein